MVRRNTAKWHSRTLADFPGVMLLEFAEGPYDSLGRYPVVRAGQVRRSECGAF